MNQAEMKTAKAVSEYQPSSCSSMNDPGPQPLFVVLYQCLVRPCIRILQLETPANKRDIKVDRNEYVACFNLEKLSGITLNWISSPPENSTSVMYIMPEHGHFKTRIEGRKELLCQPLYGFGFNISTGECRQPKPFTGSKLYGKPVNCGGRLYILEDLDHYNQEPHPRFECYDPDKDEWEALIPFPTDASGKQPSGYYGCFVAIAVWNDTILYNLDGRQLWAYNVTKKKWYRVQARDWDNETDDENRCYNMCGKAIVIENTIYALSSAVFDVILELSIQCMESENDDDDLVYTCVLSSEMFVPGILPIGYMNGETYMWSRDLVHLGEDNFCVVQSCLNFYVVRFQPIYVINLKFNKELEGGQKSMTVTNSHTYEVEIERNSEFGVVSCFSLPKYKTLCKTKHGLIYDFEFDLKAEGLKPVQASTLGDDKKGNYIYVRNLPAEVTKEQLVKELTKFGPIKGDVIWVNENGTGMCSASVEFESATSKTRAIKASTIKLGRGWAEIEEKTIAAPSLSVAS